MSVFKTYDIRGVWGEGIDAAFGYRLGRGLARFLKTKSVLLGYDARLHSAELYKAAAAGFVDEGVAVSGTALCSTPLLHFTQMDKKFPAAVMVTASHNPKEYHGFKVFDGSGGSISFDKGLNEVEKIVAGIRAPTSVPAAEIRQVEGLDRYVRFIAGAAGKRANGTKVVIDVSNGSSGKVFRRLADKLAVQAVILNENPDGNFPRHDPNPLKEESKVQAAKSVVDYGAAFGVILDGDGDRILFVDEKGARHRELLSLVPRRRGASLAKPRRRDRL